MVICYDEQGFSLVNVLLQTFFFIKNFTVNGRPYEMQPYTQYIWIVASSQLPNAICELKIQAWIVNKHHIRLLLHNPKKFHIRKISGKFTEFHAHLFQIFVTLFLTLILLCSKYIHISRLSITRELNKKMIVTNRK